MFFSYKKKALLYFTLGYLLLAYSLFGVLSCLVSIGMQRNEGNHPIKLLQEQGPISQFFLKMSHSKQRKYLILGISAGIISGICFGAACDNERRSKNQK